MCFRRGFEEREHRGGGVVGGISLVETVKFREGCIVRYGEVNDVRRAVPVRSVDQSAQDGGVRMPEGLDQCSAEGRLCVGVVVDF